MLMHTFNIAIGTIGILCTMIIFMALIFKLHKERKRSKLRLHNNVSNPPGTQIYAWRIALDHLTNICILSFFIHAASVSLIHFDLYPASHLFCVWVTRSLYIFIYIHIHLCRILYIVHLYTFPHLFTSITKYTYY